MKKKSDIQLKNIAKQILQYENVINSENTSDKSVQSAKDDIKKIMYSLSLEDMLRLDEFIHDLTK